MTHRPPLLLLLATLLALAACSDPRPLHSAVHVTPAKHPLVQAHAHNDYEHARPLYDALALGFCSVEADVHLRDGQLLVAHWAIQTSRERTLQALYLDPLRRLAAANGGRVHAGYPTLTLLIDIKSDAEATYAALLPVLESYADVLTAFTPTGVDERAATVILSGNRPRTTLAAATHRLAAMDGRPSDLEGDSAAALIPLVSARWGSLFSWGGDGPLPEEERTKLDSLCTAAHAQGRRLRFWATPESPEVWAELQRAGVDLIGTDQLRQLSDFLTPARAQ